MTPENWLSWVAERRRKAEEAAQENPAVPLMETELENLEKVAQKVAQQEIMSYETLETLYSSKGCESILAMPSAWHVHLAHTAYETAIISCCAHQQACF